MLGSAGPSPDPLPVFGRARPCAPAARSASPAGPSKLAGLARRASPSTRPCSCRTPQSGMNGLFAQCGGHRRPVRPRWGREAGLASEGRPEGIGVTVRCRPDSTSSPSVALASECERPVDVLVRAIDTDASSPITAAAASAACEGSRPLRDPATGLQLSVDHQPGRAHDAVGHDLREIGDLLDLE